jgi:hypothetical protein
MTDFRDGEDPPAPRDDAGDDAHGDEWPRPEEPGREPWREADDTQFPDAGWPERDLASGGRSDANPGEAPPEPPELDAQPEPPAEPEQPPNEPPSPAEPEQPEQPQEAPLPAVEATPASTSFSGDPGGNGWDPSRDPDRRKPTTAEQAVPWLIGLILALTGMVIVLLALIFVGPDGTGLNGSPTPSPQQSSSVSAQPSESASVAPTQAPTASPTPAPTYGPLEMTYLARSTANAPTYLYRHDFTTTDDPSVLAQASQGVSSHSWAPDGRNGVAIISGRLVSITAGAESRNLADSVNAAVFGNDNATVYAIRVTRNGGNDDTSLLAIDFATGETRTVATVSYPFIQTFPDPPLRESQFVDNGGLIRIYPLVGGKVTVWILTAPAVYTFDPATGDVTEAEREPILWSPDETYTLALVEKANNVTTLSLRDKDGAEVAKVDVSGLVSHVRWAGGGNEVVFTLGRSSAGGGVRQDLYVWDLVTDRAPSALTSNGASFGAEWLGVRQIWLP